MTGVALGVDHVGVVGPDLTALASDFRRLGFHVTPRATHAGGRTGNHCVMFENAYLELIGTIPGGASATLAGFLARHAGAHTLAFAIDDPVAAATRLARAGYPGLAPYDTERALDESDPAAARVRFTLITPPDPAFGRVHLIHHHTRATLFAPTIGGHPNRAIRLAELVITASAPAEVAAVLSRVTGRAVVVDPDGGLRLDQPGCAVRVLSDADRPDAPAPPAIAEVTVLTDDTNRAARAILDREAMVYHEDGAALVTRHHALTIRFEPTASEGA